MEKPASPEAYLADLPERSRVALETLRAVVRSAAPDATEGISYAMPAFLAHGRGLVAYAAFKDHYSLFPLGGGLLVTLATELAPYVAGKGTIRFSYDAALPEDLVRRIVAIRLEQNAARARR